ncbi:hypothetical protein [Sinorhizobium meliloti]|uniref:hypothetical protein n=1 Tax=Rhizobium meliloti TaxID=382 RepID=UPI003F5CD692
MRTPAAKPTAIESTRLDGLSEIAARPPRGDATAAAAAIPRMIRRSLLIAARILGFQGEPSGRTICS